jgi:hypothetical protein
MIFILNGFVVLINDSNFAMLQGEYSGDIAFQTTKLFPSQK